MKSIKYVLLIFICVCSFSCYSNKEWSKEDVIGVWKATKESLKNQNKVYSFQLKEDSTAIIWKNESAQGENIGKWSSNIEKKIGNKNIGISLNFDVKLNINRTLILGLLLTEKSGTLCLTAGDYEFEKIE